MKEIKAYVKPHKLSEITLALQKVEGLNGMSVTDVRGFGRDKSGSDRHTKAEELSDFIPHVKIEIVCSDDLVEELVALIESNAHTGLKGDGKIFISEVKEAIRIKTGERGDHAT